MLISFPLSLDLKLKIHRNAFLTEPAFTQAYACKDIREKHAASFLTSLSNAYWIVNKAGLHSNCLRYGELREQGDQQRTGSDSMQEKKAGKPRKWKEEAGRGEKTWKRKA